MSRYLPEFGFLICVVANMALALAALCECTFIPREISLAALVLGTGLAVFAGFLLTRGRVIDSDAAAVG